MHHVVAEKGKKKKLTEIFGFDLEVQLYKTEN
jgi:hypothetical protein